MNVLSVNIKRLRENHKVSQLEVSKAVGITTRYYQELEYGKKEPTISKVIALADYFDVSIDYLVGRTGTPEINR